MTKFSMQYTIIMEEFNGREGSKRGFINHHNKENVLQELLEIQNSGNDVLVRKVMQLNDQGTFRELVLHVDGFKITLEPKVEEDMSPIGQAMKVLGDNFKAAFGGGIALPIATPIASPLATGLPKSIGFPSMPEMPRPEATEEKKNPAQPKLKKKSPRKPTPPQEHPIEEDPDQVKMAQPTDPTWKELARAEHEKQRLVDLNKSIQEGVAEEEE